MTIENFDLDPVESAFVNEEAARIIMQVESWYETRRDKLTQLVSYLENADVVEINGNEIADKNKLKWLKFGVSIAHEQLSDFPLETSKDDD